MGELVGALTFGMVLYDLCCMIQEDYSREIVSAGEPRGPYGRSPQDELWLIPVQVEVADLAAETRESLEELVRQSTTPGGEPIDPRVATDGVANNILEWTHARGGIITSCRLKYEPRGLRVNNVESTGR